MIHSIKQIDGVRNATIIEKEDAVRIFKDQFGENIVDLLGYNPLPVSAVVNLDRNRRDRLRVEPIINQIRAIEQVEEIRYQGNLISKIERNYKRVIDQLPYLSGIIILVTVLIIYNTIKLSVYSRRDLIKTLQLIGATRTFIKLPFIIEGVLVGLISVIFVFPALIITVEGLNYIISNFSSLGLKLSFDPFVWFWLFLIVVAITILGSYRAASGFLK
ncbi:hypothetical protein Ct9H90mP29_10060 [bacterium]|nr:MAG: hypothetical protein Ct9H90mP29_10060 [bacterium]